MVIMRWIAVLLLAIASAPAVQAAGRPSTPLEASMLVTGHVFIEPDGNISDWELDNRGKLPPAVVELIGRAAPGWRFEPVLVDDIARRAKARMSLRLMANQLEDGNYRVSIRSAHFGKEAVKAEGPAAASDSDVLRTLRRRQPVYPMWAANRGVRGSVYVLLRVGRDGLVQDAIAEQVNLRTLDTPARMERMRAELANSAVRAIREWTFQPPTTGGLAQRDEWSGRITVDYLDHDESAAGNGEWHAYFPGPRQRAPWLEDDDIDATQSPDTMLVGGFQPVGSGLKLLTPLQGG